MPSKKHKLEQTSSLAPTPPAAKKAKPAAAGGKGSTPAADDPLQLRPLFTGGGDAWLAARVGHFIYPRICFVGIEDLFGLVAKKLLDNAKKRQKEAEEESQKRAFKLNGNGGSQKSGCC